MMWKRRARRHRYGGQYLRRPPHDLVDQAVEMVARLLRLPIRTSTEDYLGHLMPMRVRRLVA